EAKAATLTLDAIATDYLKRFVNHPDRRENAAKEMKRLVNATCDTIIEPVGGTPIRFGTLEATRIDAAAIDTFQFARRQVHESRLAAKNQIERLIEAHRVSGGTDPLTLPEDLVKAARYATSSEKSGRVAANRMLSRLRHLFGWAKKHKLVTSSPF